MAVAVSERIYRVSLAFAAAQIMAFVFSGLLLTLAAFTGPDWTAMIWGGFVAMAIYQ